MKPYAIGIDVGGTKIAAGVMNQAGNMLARFRTQAHSEQEPEVVIDAVVMAYQAVLREAGVSVTEIEAIGLGFGGNTNGPAGVVLTSSNLPAWDHYPLRDVVADRTKQRVYLDNDANLGALAEHRYGAGRGTQHMVYVTISTGYGIGIITDGRRYVGHHGMAGELGHTVVQIGGGRCSCGKDGCIMAYASGVGISRMVNEAIEAGRETILQRPKDGRRMSGEAVTTAAEKGDQLALDILRDAGYYGGVGISMIIQMLNPERVVIGGGLTQIGPLIMDHVDRGMREHTQPEMLTDDILVLSELGGDLGIIGAAAMAFAES